MKRNQVKTVSKHAVIAVVFIVLLAILASILILSTAYPQRTTTYASTSNVEKSFIPNLTWEDFDYVFALGDIFMEENPSATEEELENFLREQLTILSVQKQSNPFNPLFFGNITPELQRLSFRHPIRAGRVRTAANTATARTNYFYYSGLHLGSADAFRHGFWNALIVQTDGAYWAERFTTAYEGSPPFDFDDQMDLINNAIGRMHGQNYISLSENDLAYRIMTLVTLGHYRRIINPIMQGGKAIDGDLVLSSYDGLRSNFFQNGVIIKNSAAIGFVSPPYFDGRLYIPNGITTIAREAFGTTVSHLILPDTLTYIAELAFVWTNMVSITSLGHNPPRLHYNAFSRAQPPSFVNIPQGRRQAFINMGWGGHNFIEQWEIAVWPYNLTFPSMYYGENPPSAFDVWVSNRGWQPTGTLNISADNDNFTLSTTTIPSIIDCRYMGSGAGFTVRPSANLEVGTHSTTFTIAGANNLRDTFTASVVVLLRPAWEITPYSTSHTFVDMVEGGTQPSFTLQISNTGNQPTGELTLSADNLNFIFPQSLAGIAVGGITSFEIMPMADLPIGTHITIITIEGDNGIRIYFEVSITVLSVWTRIYDGYLEGSGHWYFSVGDVGYVKLIIDCSCYECCHHTGIFIIELELGTSIEFNFCYYDDCWRFVRVDYCGKVLEIIFWITDGFYFRVYVRG